jgi:hypothetical protein
MIPESYRHWQNAARKLLEPLAALMQPGRADLDRRADADHGVREVRFQAVSILGQKLTRSSPAVTLGDHLEDVEF